QVDFTLENRATGNGNTVHVTQWSVHNIRKSIYDGSDIQRCALFIEIPSTIPKGDYYIHATVHPNDPEAVKTVTSVSTMAPNSFCFPPLQFAKFDGSESKIYIGTPTSGDGV